MASPAVAVLNDDLLREVLIRLPSAADLIRAALACGSFLRAARDAPFLRRFRALHPSSPRLLGFLFHVPGGFSPPIFVSAADGPAPSTPAGGADFSLSFLLGGWRLLDYRDGHFLLQNKSLELAVADPLAQAYLLLPPFDPKAGRAVGYGLVVDDGGDEYNWAFRVVCVTRDRGSTLRALVLSSDERCWNEVANLTCDADPAVSRSNRTMHANGSLYSRLNCGKRMAALDYAAPEAMEFSVINLPPSFSRLTFDVIEKVDANGDGLINLLTMREYRIEHWVAAAAGRGRVRAGELTWKLLDKSLRFYNALESMFGKKRLRQHRQSVVIIGVVDGVVILHQRCSLLSIDLETMKLTRLSEEDCSEARIPYARKRPWPPSFLKPTA